MSAQRSLSGSDEVTSRPTPRRTKASTARELSRSVEETFKFARRCLVYVDTVHILLSRANWKDLVQNLRPRCGKVIGPKPSKSLHYPNYIIIHQPTPEAITMLIEAYERMLISRVDVAYDFETAHLGDAWGLHSFLRMHLTQPWHGRSGLVEIECGRNGGGTRKPRKSMDSTTYYRRAGSPRNIAIYSSKSKPTSKFCLHLEIRMHGHVHCRRYGLGSLSDLLRFSCADAKALLGRNCRFSAFNPALIKKGFDRFVSREMRRMSRRGKPATRAEMERLMGNYIRALSQTSDYTPDRSRLWDAPAQNLLDRFPDIAKGAVVHLPWSHVGIIKDIEFAYCIPRN